MLAEGIHNAITSGQAAAAAIDLSLESGDSLASNYRQQLRPLQRDLRSYRRGASALYRCKALSYSLLTTPVFYRRLMNGFAAGKRYCDIRVFGVV